MERWRTGCGAGLVLGGVVTNAFGWRWVFALQALAAVIIALAAVRCLPLGTQRHSRRLDLTGAGALVTAIILIVLSADMASRRGGGLTASVLIAAAVASGYLWWRRGRRHSGDAVLLDRSLLKVRGLRTAAVVASAFYFCVTGSLFLLPLYLQQVRGMSPASSGLAILPVSLAVAAAALLSGRLMKTRGPRPLLASGLLLTAGGVLLWCTAGAHSPYLGVVLVGLIVTGIGQGLAFFPAITATGLRDVPDQTHGTASALTTTALQIGSGIGPTVLAGIAQPLGSAGHATLSLPGHHLAYAAAAGLLLLIGLPVTARRNKIVH
ncbi:MFS transporter (plasmid) [Streptomyces sp. NBC_01471]|uniref:MFS transporter n=1 Tax=Streptomyces sp. NBC_01471 TaxID=2903879 RepID=UPI002F910F5E